MLKNLALHFFWKPVNCLPFSESVEQLSLYYWHGLLNDLNSQGSVPFASTRRPNISGLGSGSFTRTPSESTVPFHLRQRAALLLRFGRPV
jgi:hypothetical protein